MKRGFRTALPRWQAPQFVWAKRIAAPRALDRNGPEEHLSQQDPEFSLGCARKPLSTIRASVSDARGWPKNQKKGRRNSW